MEDRLPSPTASPRASRRRTKARPIYARWLLLGLGWVIIAIGVAIGPLPGPGPVILVPLGLALVLRNSIWAKRVYIRTKKRHEAFGKWTDWALGRAHHQPFRPRLPSLREVTVQLFRRKRRG